jgi:predicted ATPase
VDDAMASSGSQHGQMWYLPELLRVKAEILRQQGSFQSASAAEGYLDQAGEMAGEQDALFWALRIALTFARLRVSQGRNDEARGILAPVYDRFTEGFATADMLAARGMLDGLPL